MSNTSYSFKENSHVIVNQGGEKKVMKKILSVALSTAMAFSMFASVAFGADNNLTPQQKFDVLKEAGIVTGYPDGTAGLDKAITRAELAKVIVNAIDLEPVTGVATYTDKNYTASHWAAPYIEAATAAGIMEGKDSVKKLFDPTGNVTVQELAKVLVIALDLEVPTETNNTASDWAKGYVEAAVKAGYLDAGINYQANATRSQVVIAAHAVYEANQVPTVSSYEVVDPSNVTFTLSNGEKVEVALETPLVANKETEVKFTHNGVEYTEKVTYVTTVAQAVQSVTAENLKEVVVVFDGTVDKVSAENENNYVISGKSFESATLSEDKTTVTLLLAEGSELAEQKQTKLEIKNVLNEDGTKTFNEKVEFTPIDVTAPTIKEVVGLGTKAFKVVFSEPVDKTEAVVATNYRVDGKGIAASVKYAYPDTVIVVTDLAEGTHTLRVSEVEDFAGLQVAPVENEFEVAVDTEAPEIVSIETDDLKEVTVTFNETIKDVKDGYANSSSKDLKVTKIKDNKVTLVFKDSDDKLNTGENTIHLNGVSDYSGNKADREGTVTPTLDTIRPTVVDVDFEKKNGNYIAKIEFSETLNSKTAKDKDNYTLVDEDGDPADIAGVNKDGHPTRTIEYDSVKNIVTIDFGTEFDDEYTLEIEGIEDDAVIANTMLPYSVALDPEGTEDADIARVWLEEKGSKGHYVYIEFNSEISADNDDHAKFSFSDKDDASNTKLELTDDDDDIAPIGKDTIRIYTEEAIGEGDTVYASYIKDADGDYLKDGDDTPYTLQQVVNSTKIVEEDGVAKATALDTVEISFKTALSTVDEDDFVIVNTVSGKAVAYVDDYELKDKDKKLVLTLDRDLPLANFKQGTYSLATVDDNTQDQYGNAVDFTWTNDLKNKAIELKDEIDPEVDEVKYVSTTDATYLDFTLDQDVRFTDYNDPTAKAVRDLFDIDVLGAGDVTVKRVDIVGEEVEIDGVTYKVGNVIRVQIETTKAIADGTDIEIEYKDPKGYIQDPYGNTVKDYSDSILAK
ncbi:S-layer homology domain-containing protein [Paenibacillus sp. M1]|uniref:S-layer homology domain-containing protein n=1 Tax=Paenibacillus haidiansis TaxID=1574488 RepID=A0ABU7VX44_9BACL